MTSEQKQSLFTAKVAAVPRHETSHVPSREQMDEVALLARVLYKAVLGVHFTRKQREASGQLPIF